MGGSYERAKAHFDWFCGDENTIYSFPTNLATAQKAGILITALDTDASAARASCAREIWILELGHINPSPTCRPSIASSGRTTQPRRWLCW